MRKAVFLRFSCMKKHPIPLLDKAGLHGYNIRKGTLLQQSDPYRIKIYLMTVWGLAKRSSRFYTGNVQQNCCTYKKLKSLFLHTRHLQHKAPLTFGQGRCCSYSPSSFFALL